MSKKTTASLQVRPAGLDESEKKYQIVAHTAEQWQMLHQDLIADGNQYFTVPSREVEVKDSKNHSPTRGVYLLTEVEAEELSEDPRVKSIHLDPQSYRDAFHFDPDDLKMYVPPKVNRYPDTFPYGGDNPDDFFEEEFTTANNNHNFIGTSSSVLVPNFNEINPGRSTGQLLRCQQKENPWIAGQDPTAVIVGTNTKRGAGEDVDLVVADEGGWIAHVEFMNDVNGQLAPHDFKTTGNLLSATGKCSVLDIVLDSPYYIDPEWFDSDPDNRLETRWDGTVVPVDSVARSWWSDSTQRSPEFSAIGIVDVYFGYSRESVHGDYSQGPQGNDGDHGTQCMGLAFGRTQGWAYNANKWHLNLYGANGIGAEAAFDIMKLFHLYKPNNSNRGNTKDPTIMSNSWGVRQGVSYTGTDLYYKWRNDPTQQWGNSDASLTPEYLKYSGIGYSSPTNGTQVWYHPEFAEGQSTLVAAEEMLDAGVIFVCAAGNGNTQHCGPDNPNFNNFLPSNLTETIDDYDMSSGTTVLAATNRPGYPAHIGKGQNYNYRTIQVGTLDVQWTGLQERKVNYSNYGELIDCYAPGHASIAAARPGDGDFNRNVYDSYPDSRNDYPGTYLKSFDAFFGGTSAACPIAAGLIATVVANNRNWTMADVKSWLKNDLEEQGSAMYNPAEPNSPNDADWSLTNSIFGSDTKVIYENDYTATTPTNPPIKKTIAGRVNLSGNISIRYR